jgi:hypothetical protein
METESIWTKRRRFAASLPEVKSVIVKVKYQNNRYDLIKGEVLTQFIAEGKIKEFYRYSEERWVTVGSDPTRTGRGGYTGPERRSRDGAISGQR